MNKDWLMIFGVILAGSILKHVFFTPITAVIINFAVFGVAYLILRRNPYVDMKRSLFFLAGMLILASFVDMGLINGYIGDIGLLALLAWMFFSQGRPSGRLPRQRHQWHK